MPAKRGPSPAACVERALLLGLACATSVTLLFVAMNGLAPADTSPTFGWVFLQWATAFYLLWVPLPTLLSWGVGRLLGWPRLPWAVAAATATAILLAVNVGNRDIVPRLLALEGPDHFRRLAPVAYVLASAGLMACAAMPVGRRWVPRALCLLALLAAAWAFAPSARRSVATAEAPTPAAAKAPGLVLVGIDGADWKLMAPLLARGELPSIAALRGRGAFGDLATIRPTFSPAIWTTIVTGQAPSRHGIEDFSTRRVAGVAEALRSTRLPEGVAFGGLYHYLEDSGRITEGPVVSSERRVPAFWELATAQGSPIAVVNFWATWPAEPVLGSVVSERLYYWRQQARSGAPPEEGHLTFPASLYDEIRPLTMAPEDVSFEDSRAFMDVSPEEFEAMRHTSLHAKSIQGEFKYLYSMFETQRRISLHLIDRTRRRFGAPADLLVLFRIVDIASHRSLAESELVEDHLDATDGDVRKFGRVVSEAYRRADAALGEILAAFGDANVVVVSDHGFRREPFQGRPRYQHSFAPPGIFLGAGPAFRPGPVEGLTVFDVFPLLACLKGFPVAEDLRGHLREDLLAPAFLASHPVRRVPTYGPRGSPILARSLKETDDAFLERLRALGYIQ